jgi:DNA-binding response OmpR family regulator
MQVVLPSCGMKSRGRLLLIRRDVARRICGSGSSEQRDLHVHEATAGLPATEAETSPLHDILFRERDRHVRLLGCDVDLSFAGFELLRLLAERHPEVVSKREIAEHLGIRPMAN